MAAASSEAPQIPVPLLDLGAQFAVIGEKVEEAVTRVVRSGHYILGPEVDAFELEMAQYCGCAHGIGVSSGTDALLVSLMAEGIGGGDEVIVPDYSFFATAGAVCRVGATPVFVDIDPVTYNMDPGAAARAITARTRAIIPVHLFGQMADMDALLELASTHGIAVIEDAAQAVGAELAGRRAGSVGHYGCLSFFPSKNLGGLGDGGMVVTSDDERAERLRLLRVHGAKPKYHHQIVGGNFRLDAIQAAALRVKLQHLEMWTEARRRNAEAYRAALVGIPGLETPREKPGHRHVFNQFVVSTEDREWLRRGLAEAGIGTEIYYPVPFHRQKCFEALVATSSAFPASTRAAATSLALPVFPEMTDDQHQRVSGSVRAVLAEVAHFRIINSPAKYKR
ncbi:MAG: DegT/DnrJ/EryC1/StrS family aminotransferase [Thermoanaerobaculia bacterium]|nr:DegT/DnrJ/EryC1/StrS family aminotransferase [Thermoanaerobaculia bacterium]